MDVSLSDVLWAAGIVVAIAVIGIGTAIYNACGGSFSLGGVGRGAGLFFRALTWRILPALTSWYEQNKDRAVNRYERERDQRPMPHLSHMSSDGKWEEGDRAFTHTPQQNNNATTTDCNEESGNNGLLLNKEAAIVARFVKAGVVGETKGLQIAFGVKPSSTSRAYQEARDALKEELAKLEPPVHHTPIANRPTREVFRSDGSGI